MLVFHGAARFTEVNTKPAPPSPGHVFVYAKTDNKLYTLTDTNIETELGAGSQVLTGNGPPDNSLGANGDLYLDLTAGSIYSKISDVWVFQGALAPGSVPAGGLTGQILTKQSNSDGDVIWSNPSGDPNTFSIYNSFGTLDSQSNVAFDPALFNRVTWTHNVVPNATEDYNTLHSIYTTYNPVSPSRQGYNDLYIEAGIGTDDSGFQVGDYSDVKATLTKNDVTFTANRRGTDGNVVSVEFTAGGTAGAEVLTNPSSFDYVLQIADGVSTATQIVAAISAQISSLGNNLIATVSGVGSNPQTIFGPNLLAGGVNDSGGISVLPVTLFSRNKSNVGFVNGISFDVDFGNGTDAVHGNRVRAFGGSVNIRDNADFQNLSVLEYSFNNGTVNSNVNGDVKGIVLNGTLNNIAGGIQGINLSWNANNVDYVNAVQVSNRINGDVEQSVNTYADFNSFLGDIAQNYYGVSIQPNINSVDGFFGINISPNVTLSRNNSVGVNVDMNNVFTAPGVKASLVIQDLTVEADQPGTELNSYTVQYNNDGTAGSETAEISGNAFIVHIQSGVSTATQIKAALEANIPIAANLSITVSGVGSNPQITQGPTFLAGGIDPGTKKAAFLTGDVTIQGKTELGYNFDTATEVLPFVYSVNNFSPTFKISSGSPISGGQFGFGNNLSTNLDVQDDVLPDATGFGLGFTMTGTLTQVQVAAGKTMDALSFYANGASIPAGSGSITNVAFYRTIGLIPQGGTVNVTNMYAFKAESLLDAAAATNLWGVYVDASTAENYMAKSLAIGTATKKVSSSDTALEIGSVKALRTGNTTTAQKLALSVNAGSLVFDTDLNQLSYFDGVSWINI